MKNERLQPSLAACTGLRLRADWRRMRHVRSPVPDRILRVLRRFSRGMDPGVVPSIRTYPPSAHPGAAGGARSFRMTQASCPFDGFGRFFS